MKKISYSRKAIVSLVLVLSLLLSSFINVFAASSTGEGNNKMVIEPRISYVTSETVPSGYKASDYTEYISTGNGNTLLDTALNIIAVSALSTAICVATGLTSVSQVVPTTIISTAVSLGCTGKTLYYTIKTYQNTKSTFESKLIYTYYGDSAKTKKLYTQTVYRTKIPG